MLSYLLKLLSKRKSSSVVFNQYKNKDIRNNLKLFFDYLIKNKNSLLIVGEAPGYNGCRLTGIPFTSGAVIENSEHKIFKKIRSKIILRRVVSENTATVIWSYIGTNKRIPILWNAFPFHCHKKGLPETNRRPSSSEIKEGKRYLKMVYGIFKPKKLCSIGRVGERVLKELFPGQNIIYIRHPSYGGKKKFIEGMKIL